MTDTTRAAAAGSGATRTATAEPPTAPTAPKPAGGRRDRVRADTGAEIRAAARTLLVEHGIDAVTLRAIARQLGITAPALYRYYNSREDLLDHLRQETCAELAAELTAEITKRSADDHVGRVYAICRTFRRWALTHPQEFTLVFASPVHVPEETGPECWQEPDPLGQVFLGAVVQIMSVDRTRISVRTAPDALHADLTVFRHALLDGLAKTGITVPDGMIELGGLYEILRFWVRLYGHVALEVFGRFPIPLGNGEALFESMLTELLAEVGLLDPDPAPDN